MEKKVRKGSWSVSWLEFVGETKAGHVGLNSSYLFLNYAGRHVVLRYLILHLMKERAIQK